MGSPVEIDQILPHIYWVHKAPSRALDSSNGVLICTPTEAITLDVNLPKADIEVLYDFLGNLPHTSHICTHLHIDHVTHLHNYQALGPCRIYAPAPDAPYFADIAGHRKDFGYDAAGIGDAWTDLVFNEFHFQPIHSPIPFSVDETLTIGDVQFQCLPFSGHSPGHVGFQVTCGTDPTKCAGFHFSPQQNQFLFYSDLGFDIGGQGFGPWYGFKTLSLPDFRAQVDFAEALHKRTDLPMMSSHGPVYPAYSPEPYAFVRRKFAAREEAIVAALLRLGGRATMAQLLDEDIIYPKAKMRGNIKTLVAYWEEGFLFHHLEELKRRKAISQMQDHFILWSETANLNHEKM